VAGLIGGRLEYRLSELIARLLEKREKAAAAAAGFIYIYKGFYTRPKIKWNIHSCVVSVIIIADVPEKNRKRCLMWQRSLYKSRKLQ
jgi:hypothetical protein